MFVKFIGANDKELTGEVILSETRLKRLTKRLEAVEELAFDTETNTLRVHHEGEMGLVGISLCFGEEDAYYIPTGHFFDDNQLEVDLVVKHLRPVFERKDIRIIAHNLKFDRHVLANIGIQIFTNDIFDTMLARWITDENKEKGLKGMTSQIYGVKQTKFDECLSTVTTEEKKAYGLKGANKAPFHLVRIAIGAPYAIADAYWTWRHYVDWQLDELVNEEMETIFYKVQMPFLNTLYNMERRGIRININKLKEMQKKAEKDLEQLHYDMVEIAGVEFNPASSQQLSELLFGYKKINKVGEFSGNIELIENGFNFPVVSLTAGGAPQTGDSQLKQLSKVNYKRDKRKQEGIELVKLLLRYKKLNKLKSAFIDGLLNQVYADGKVHPSFNQVGTDSGRLSCIAEYSLVKLVGEDKPIQDVEVGDLVYCYDEENNLRISPVTKTYNNGKKDTIKITFRSQGNHDYIELKCTPEHQIKLASGEWIRADELKKDDRVAHLRRSFSGDRPRLYGVDGYCKTEQITIKEEYFGVGGEMSIHHKDENPLNNDISNLEVMTKREHSKLHGDKAYIEGKVEFRHLIERENRHLDVLRGVDHPHYLKVSVEELELMVHEAEGIITKIPMDFETFKKKCEEVNFDYMKIAGLYQKQYNNPSREIFEESFFRNEGKRMRVMRDLNIGRDKFDKLVKEYDLCYNHKVVCIEVSTEENVYDLEVETYHNYIANEICVHNCSEPNLQQLPRPIELPTKEEWDALNKGVEYEVKFKEELFWKFYEIRDAFIPDSPEDEVIIALD